MAVRRLGKLPYPLSLSTKASWRVPSNIICSASYLLSKAFLSKSLYVLVYLVDYSILEWCIVEINVIIVYQSLEISYYVAFQLVTSRWF